MFIVLTQEDLQAISLLIKNEVEPINKRLDKIEQTLEQVKEDGEITRDVTNKLGEWVDFYFHDDKPYPVDSDEIKEFDKHLKFAE